MTEVLLATAGVILIVLANYDALATTIALGSGARPLSARLASGLRRILRRFPPLMPAGGPLVTLTIVSVWIVLLWTGYSVLFSAADDAVVSASTNVPASGISRVYFAGFTLFTLGTGDYRPTVGVWQIVTVLGALNGLFVVTLSITFLVPVVSAVVERRQHAGVVNALGETAEDVLVATWDGNGFPLLEQQLPSVAQQVMLTAQRHLAYPVLHDFRSREPYVASARTLALLDDVLTLIHRGVDPSVSFDRATIQLVRAAIDEAKDRMPIGVDENFPAPLPPDLSVLSASGIPTVSPDRFDEAVRAMADRRRHLARLVHAAAWTWPNRNHAR